MGRIAGTFYEMLVDKQTASLPAAFVWAAMLYSAEAGVASMTDWWSERTAVSWRKQLTGALQAHYCTHAAPKGWALHADGQGVDNLDQRMTQDVALLCTNLGAVARVVAAVPFKLVYYAFWTAWYTGAGSVLAACTFFAAGMALQGCVWGRRGVARTRVFCACFTTHTNHTHLMNAHHDYVHTQTVSSLYVVMRCTCTPLHTPRPLLPYILRSHRLVVRPLASMVATAERCEGDLRFAHMRMRHHAADIAMARGSAAELARVDRLLQGLTAVLLQTTRQRWVVGAVSKCLDYGGMLVNYGCIAWIVFCTGTNKAWGILYMYVHAAMPVYMQPCLCAYSTACALSVGVVFIHV